jgi:transcriptional regulator with XRE-family HTH domain
MYHTHIVSTKKMAAKYEGLGAFIRSHRERQGMATQGELAARLSVAQQTVSRWEAGSSRPRTDELARIAALLKIDFAELSAAARYAADATTVSFDRPLPLAGLSPESFELLCLDFLATIFRGQADVRPAGKTGHKQYGIDIEARFVDDDGLFTFQCKREAQFGAAKVVKAITAHTIPAKKKHILLSRVASPDARKEVRKAHGWDLWDQTDITRLFRTLPKIEQIRIVDTFFPSQRYALTGELAPGPWLTVYDFFAPQLAEGRIFNQRWDLVGRTGELEQLESALADRSVLVSSLIGRAGEGKSRVLRTALDEFCASYPEVRVFVASPTAEIDAKSLEDLGTGEKLVVVDDVHDRFDIGQLIRYVADERSNARLLLVYRPYWHEVVQRDLARSGLAGGLVASVTLARPTKQDATKLATQVLAKHGASTDMAATIASIAYDSPLAVVVGAQIVAKEGVHPELFGSNDAFRSTVLKHYEQVIAEGIAKGKDQDRVRAILRVLALIQPVVPDDRRVLELLAEIEGIAAPDASRLGRLLIDSGVVFKRGASYRLSPDLLADSIIESACITSSSESNGYAERIFDAAIPEHKEHLLLNLGRLDWRRNEGDTSSSHLLDAIWSRIQWNDDYQNAQVKAAAAAAYYQPRQALQLARLLIDEGHGTAEDVCRIIRGATYNLKYLSAACDLLWELAKEDTRPTNPHPNHPLRLLTELATPEPRKPINYCEAAVDFALSQLGLEESWTGQSTPYDVLKGALATEGHFTAKSTHRELTLSAYGVNVETVAPMRHRVVDAILDGITSDNQRQAFAAAELLNSALRGPIGLLNRAPSATERADWSQEFVDTLQRVNGVLESHTIAAPVLVRIGQSVSWHAYQAGGATGDEARRVLDRLDRNLETRVTRILMDGWGHDTWKFQAGSLDRNEQRQEELASEVEGAFPNECERAAFLERRLADLKCHGVESLGSAHLFVNRLIDRQPALAREVLDAKECNPRSPIADYGSFALSSLLRREPTEAHRSISMLLARGDEHLPFVARAYAMGALGGRQLDYEDRDVIRQIFRSSDTSVLATAAWVFREVAEKDKRFAIEILADASPKLMRVSRGEIFMWLDDDKFIPFDSIPNHDLTRIVELLTVPDSLDDHYLREFLARVAKREPGQVVELAKKRLDQAIAAENWKYSPIGVLSGGAAESLNLLAHPDGAMIFRETLDWALPRAAADYQFSYRFAELVTGVFGCSEPSFASTLEAWCFHGGATHYAVVAAVLRETPNSFVFGQHAFVLRILRAARALGRSVQKAVSSSLFASALGGVRSGIPGQPFPTDLDMKQRAEHILASLAKSDPAFSLYDDIRAHAEESIGRSRREGLIMDEEDADS